MLLLVTDLVFYEACYTCYQKSQENKTPTIHILPWFSQLREGKKQERSKTCLELTHQPSPLPSCVYPQSGLVTQAPCLPQTTGIYAAKLPEN